MSHLKAIVLGFIAGAIAVVTVHEFISWLFNTYWTGWDRVSWDMDPNDFGVSKIVSATFWGGLWGSVFALILGRRPTGALTFRGAILGILLPAVLGVFILVPLLTARFPMFFGGDASKIIPVLCILAGWGALTAWLYGLFQYGHLPGDD